MKVLETGDASQTSQDSAIENSAGRPQVYTSASLTRLGGLGREGVAFSFELFLLADHTGVGPDFVQMSAGAAYDLVRYKAEALRVGDMQ
jgi:hypothetical protein